MRIIEKTDEMTRVSDSHLKEEVGFVPTMGALHKGHESLIRRSCSENRITVVSIFVNRTQFNDKEDFDKYPVSLEKDIELCKKAGVDYVFIPAEEDIYRHGFKTRISIPDMESVLCGKYRPNHFKGVLTIVLKLVNLVRPKRLYLGSKDAQQASIIRMMFEDLFISTEIIYCPTVREDDGLALSSRNKHLSKAERDAAPLIRQELLKAARDFKSGMSSKEVRKSFKKTLDSNHCLDVQYLSIHDWKSLKKLDSYTESIEKKYSSLLIAAAVTTLSNTRLIDNVILRDGRIEGGI
jgi:pantoate--beta-alanine ligase